MKMSDFIGAVLVALLFAAVSLLTRYVIIDAIWHRPPMQLDTIDIALASFWGFMTARWTSAAGPK